MISHPSTSCCYLQERWRRTARPFFLQLGIKVQCTPAVCSRSYYQHKWLSQVPSCASVLPYHVIFWFLVFNQQNRSSPLILSSELWSWCFCKSLLRFLTSLNLYCTMPVSRDDGGHQLLGKALDFQRRIQTDRITKCHWRSSMLIRATGC